MKNKKNYIVKSGRGYRVVVAKDGRETGQRDITDKKLVAKIERLLKIRRDAGDKLSKLISIEGPLVISANDRTIVLGEGDEPVART